jgi:phosphoribosylaminoimidazolecarboxamide formyltransferase/IMP cyclohydrolase
MKNIELVVCNFPPLKNTLRLSDFNIRNIDLGGPLMVRAAAINFRHVIPIVDAKDYKKIIKIIARGKITKEDRKKFAIKAFSYTRNYDLVISNYLKNTAK